MTTDYLDLAKQAASTRDYNGNILDPTTTSVYASIAMAEELRNIRLLLENWSGNLSLRVERVP